MSIKHGSSTTIANIASETDGWLVLKQKNTSFKKGLMPKNIAQFVYKFQDVDSQWIGVPSFPSTHFVLKSSSTAPRRGAALLPTTFSKENSAEPTSDAENNIELLSKEMEQMFVSKILKYLHRHIIIPIKTEDEEEQVVPAWPPEDNSKEKVPLKEGKHKARCMNKKDKAIKQQLISS